MNGIILYVKPFRFYNFYILRRYTPSQNIIFVITWKALLSQIVWTILKKKKICAPKNKFLVFEFFPQCSGLYMKTFYCYCPMNYRRSLLYQLWKKNMEDQRHCGSCVLSIRLMLQLVYQDNIRGESIWRSLQRFTQITTVGFNFGRIRRRKKDSEDEISRKFNQLSSEFIISN